MVRCEKREYGYEIMVEGRANDVIGEIVHLAAAYHMRVFEDDLKIDVKKDKDKVIRAATNAFGIVMSEAMHKLCDEKEIHSVVLRKEKQKGGVVQ